MAFLRSCAQQGLTCRREVVHYSVPFFVCTFLDIFTLVLLLKGKVFIGAPNQPIKSGLKVRFANKLQKVLTFRIVPTKKPVHFSGRAILWLIILRCGMF